MVYICDKCQFLFERMGEVLNCPVCNSNHIRPADDAERTRYEESKNASEQPTRD
ncbi:hypothetical protein [Pygmaiobacter massiliensis]|uniref:hypothetical protein n=1 Tax=Pygmaiobacter massiliensis TaxID=1917873 RepID=UPI0015E0EC29|nr:hypothetical protein [Pygmaiobacter massiliensis]MDY4785061.1 hypothetical protein [Pygmaiobacter massiliensis]